VFILQKNIGTIDAMMRITCGLVGLAWSASRSKRGFPLTIAMLSAMKVAEGVTRFCPMTAMFCKLSKSKTNDYLDIQSLTTPFPPQDDAKS
jgi:hypothetical protein